MAKLSCEEIVAKYTTSMRLKEGGFDQQTSLSWFEDEYGQRNQGDPHVYYTAIGEHNEIMGFIPKCSAPTFQDIWSNIKSIGNFDIIEQWAEMLYEGNLAEAAAQTWLVLMRKI